MHGTKLNVSLRTVLIEISHNSSDKSRNDVFSNLK